MNGDNSTKLYCTNCGALLDSDALFCGRCGTKTVSADDSLDDDTLDDLDDVDDLSDEAFDDIDEEDDDLEEEEEPKQTPRPKQTVKRPDWAYRDLVIASGLPEWDLVPSAAVVRRRRR